MATTLRTVRVRPGMYISVDGKFRIVRRNNVFGTGRKWWVQNWDADMGVYQDVRAYPSLQKARQAIVRLIETAF